MSSPPAATGVQTVHTFCRYCLSTCGIEVTVAENRVLKISPDRQNPYTWRDFCAKGRTAAELVEHPRRIVAPMKRVGDGYVEATWDEAISDIAARLTRIISEDGPDAVATYWGNPAGLSSSNLMFLGGFLDAIGTRNRYYVGSVDQAAFHVVATEMYGSSLMALVSDLERCDYFLVVGANPAVSMWGWIESVPGGWRTVLERRKAGAKLVVVDPVRTETAEHADRHISPRPGQDWALLLAMVKVILEEGLEHRADCADLAVGIEDVRRLVAGADLDDLAARCDVPREHIVEVAREFATAERAMAVTRTGIALHLAGTIAEWLGQLLNVITGRMDRPGGRRFERGYVDSLMLFDKMAKPLEHTSRVAGRPMRAGYHGLDELPDEITTPGRGRVRALILDAGNPVVSGPNGHKLDAAMSQLDLLVAIDLMQRESHRHAHWLLPVPHWLERDDLLAFLSGLQARPFAQFGRRAVTPPSGTREEWRIFVDLCLAMKKPLFGYRGVNTFVRATRTAARILRRPGLEFGPRWIDRLLVLTGRRAKWREIMSSPHGTLLGEPEFGRFRAALKTPDKKVHAAPPSFVTRTIEMLREPHPAPPAEFPLQLANRRNRHSMNSWLNELPSLHPGGRTNRVIINPLDAAAKQIGDGDVVRVLSPVAQIELAATVSDQPRPGVVIIDHGWGSRVFDPRGGREPESYGVNRNLLVDGAQIDPLSQTTPLNSSYVRVERA
jgi:formate dehydrogenase